MPKHRNTRTYVREDLDRAVNNLDHYLQKLYSIGQLYEERYPEIATNCAIATKVALELQEFTKMIKEQI